MANTSTFLTTSAAARLIGVAESTIRKWDASGRLQAVRASNNARLFRAEDVTRLAAVRHEQAGDEC